MSVYDCPGGWGGEPDDACPEGMGRVDQDVELVMHVNAHSCARPSGHESPHVCTCGEVHP